MCETPTTLSYDMYSNLPQSSYRLVTGIDFVNISFGVVWPLFLTNLIMSDDSFSQTIC